MESRQMAEELTEVLLKAARGMVEKAHMDHNWGAAHLRMQTALMDHLRKASEIWAVLFKQPTDGCSQAPMEVDPRRPG